ncbi:MAG TPA: cyanophycin synthetase, partial [Anaerolineae bacterium]|nr:cyanophycin synthetase [Anaerolineae bacterium]
KETGSKFIYVSRNTVHSIDNSSIYYCGLSWKFNKLDIPLKGLFQHENATVALTALEILASEHHSITPECARRGIENVYWPGRLQTVSLHPEVIVDGACNIGAMMALRDYLLGKKSKDKIVAVFGICKDKEVDKVLEILGQVTTRIVITQANNPRALSAEALAQRCNNSKKNIVEKDPIKAVQKAVSIAGTDGLVIVTGSLYLVGEVLKNYELNYELKALIL